MSTAEARRPRAVTVVAVAGAVVAALAVALLVVALRDTGHSPAGGRVALHQSLTDVAGKAPCASLVRDPQPAGRDAVRRFRTAAVVNCRTVERTFPGQGQWQVLVRQVAVRDLAPLLRALVRPDEQSPTAGACPAIGYLPLTILLADGNGHYLHPRAPLTPCGAPQPQTLRAVAHLQWRTVSTVKVRQLVTPAALASGCAMGWKNELVLLGPTLPRSAGGPVELGGVNDPLTACLYRRAGEPDVGTFQRALRLTGTRATELRAALSHGAPTGTCAPQPDFVVVRSTGGAWVNVELGGCWRVLRNDQHPNGYGGGDAAAISRLLALR